MRLRIITIIICLMFLILLIGLAYIQLIKGDFYNSKSEHNRIRLIPLSAPRGIIYDRNGKIVVKNRLSFCAAVIPQEVKELDDLFSFLSQVLGKNKNKLMKIYKSKYTTPFSPVIIASDITKKEAVIIEEEGSNLSGLLLQTIPVRYYPHKNIASHLIGYIGKINEREYRKLKLYGYKVRDWVGKYGIEKKYDSYLKGVSGGMQIEVNSKGDLIKVLGKKLPVRGKDIKLTIDLNIQRIVSEQLKNKKGAIIVMEPDTGEILAMQSSPDFDPNIFIKGFDGEINKLLSSSDSVLLNRAISGEYPPGSIFKIITAIAGLETGVITTNTISNCTGSYKLGRRSFKCWKKNGHGNETVVMSLVHSCNVFYYRLGLKLGVDKLYNWASLFGLGKNTNVDLENEKNGFVPNKHWKKYYRKRRWFDGETLNFAIGQGYLLVTPLQMVTMISAVANKGYLVKPYIVKQIQNKKAALPYRRYLGISKKTLKTVTEGLEMVVGHPEGTGQHARVKGIRVAGKTGTAQAPGGKSHAWFVGFAPVDKPEIAFVVFVERGGMGGVVAADIAREIIKTKFAK